MEKINSHRDLFAWQKAMDLVVEVYRLAKLMPRTEEYRLTSQLLRAAASVPANIAEGHARGTRKVYANFVSIARGSLAETETFLLIMERTELVAKNENTRAYGLCSEISKMLTALLQRLKEPVS